MDPNVLAAANAQTGILYGPWLQAEIVRDSKKVGVDPVAALSVAETEGGFGPPPGNIGDSGTSFGPFQLHRGGALPSSVSDPANWANTQEGVGYAIQQIAGVAGGESGWPAVRDIVYKFERPADPGAEAAKAWGLYPLFQQEPLVQDPSQFPASQVPPVTGTTTGSSVPSGTPAPGGVSPSGSDTSTSGGGGGVIGDVCAVVCAPCKALPGPLKDVCERTNPACSVCRTDQKASGVVGGISGVTDAVKFLFSIRGVELIAGLGLIFIGVRSLAGATSLPIPKVG